MIEYTYRARDARGEAVRGQMNAPTTHAVVEHLRARALTAVEVRKRPRVARTLVPLRQASRAPALIVALRTLGTLLAMGLPIRRALEIVIESTRRQAFREGFRAVLASVENGESLGTAMEQHSDLFSPMVIALVHAGERGGLLAETLERHASHLEQQHALRRRLLTMMIYPSVVLCTALGLVGFLLLSVLPMFATLFEQLRVEEPLPLRAALALPSLFSPANCALAVLLAGLFGAAIYRKRSALRLPVIEPLREKAVTAGFARALAGLLKAGVPLSEALLCLRPVLALERYRKALDRILSGLRDGNTLASASEMQGVFDPLFIHLIRVGEETGTLDLQLYRLAEWFERDLNEATARAAALIEPALILGIGALVGTIVFSVFVPLYSLVGSVR
jgi:type IV pilus assembly protein PilC